MNYIEKPVFKAAIVAYQADGVWTDSLQDQLTLLINGVMCKWARECEDADGLRQELWILLFKTIPKIVVSRGDPFAYLTTVIINAIRQNYRSQMNYRKSVGYSFTDCFGEDAASLVDKCAVTNRRRKT